MAIKRGTGDIAVQEIRAAIAKYGPEGGPKLLRETTYRDASRPTWFRWLAKAKAGTKTQAAIAIQRAMEITPADVLPTPPSPAVIAHSPVTQRANLDFMGKLDRLYSDGEMLRAFSVVIAPDGVEKIKIASHFANSIKIRSDLLERWIQASQMLFDWQQMNGFYDAIVAEISKEDPEVAQRIMERLAELNRDKGFNAHGQI